MKTHQICLFVVLLIVVQEHGQDLLNPDYCPDFPNSPEQLVNDTPSTH